MANIGNPPHRDKPDSIAWQQYNAAISRQLNYLGQTAVTDAVASSVTVTSSDASTVVRTVDANVGFASETECVDAITAINTIKTLANELKVDVNTLKTDLNAVVTNQNALIAALRTAGIIT